MQNLVSVIIPNYNGRKLLSDCLNSLFEQTFKKFEVILVDNNSNDNSIDYIRKKYPKVNIISLNKNYGFARAVNEGIKKSQCKYVVLLNNDTKIEKNFLKELVKTAEKNPEIFSINPKILNFYNPKIIDGIGIQINEVGQARSIGYGEKDLKQFKKPQYIFGATGGASLFRRNLFKKTGLFDEDFFMYSEEVDLAFRAQFLGYKSLYCPRAIVWHKHKATSKNFPEHIEYWQFKNMYQVIIKDFPTKTLFKRFRILKIILVYFNTIFYQIKNGFLWPPLFVTIWLMVNLPKLLLKRHKIQTKKRVDSSYIEEFLIKKDITFWGLKQ